MGNNELDRTFSTDHPAREGAAFSFSRLEAEPNPVLTGLIHRSTSPRLRAGPGYGAGAGRS